MTIEEIDNLTEDEAQRLWELYRMEDPTGNFGDFHLWLQER